jgi:hypothetical protein
MKRERRGTATQRDRTNDPMLSRRSALSSSGLVLLGTLAGPALGQTEGRRMEPPQALIDRMRNAGSAAGGPGAMSEHFAQQRQMAFDNLKNQLQVSDEEWSVIKPRLQVVYDLVRPVPSFGPESVQPASPVDQKKRELREILSNKDAAADQVKAKLTALRAAQLAAVQELTKARQNLRQIMTLRQEATLVLNGLLD